MGGDSESRHLPMILPMRQQATTFGSFERHMQPGHEKMKSDVFSAGEICHILEFLL